MVCFAKQARNEGRRSCFFAVERSVLPPDHDIQGVHIGEQNYWHPCGWPGRRDKARSIGGQIRRARKHAVHTQIVAGSELSQTTHTQIEHLAQHWLQQRRMAPLGFVVNATPVKVHPEQVVALATRAKSLVGFALMTPISGRKGWLIQHLIRAGDAPNGTSELLFSEAMSYARARSADFVTLGLAPLVGAVAPALRLGRWLGQPLFNFAGLASFKNKLRPDDKEAVFICFCRPSTGSRWVQTWAAVRAVVDSLKAFSNGGFVRFAVVSAKMRLRALLCRTCQTKRQSKAA